MRNIIFTKEFSNNKKDVTFSYRVVSSVYDEFPKNYNYRIKLIDLDIEMLNKEISELRPLVNRLNKLRKELKDYQDLKELFVKENNRLFDDLSKME